MLTVIAPWALHSPLQAAGNTHPQRHLGGLTGLLHGRKAGTCRKPPTPTERSPAAERQVGSLSSLPAGPYPAQVFQVLLKKRKKRGRAIPEKAGHSPEVGLSELLHVELFIREGREVDITNGREHVSWEARRVLVSRWDILQGLAEPPKGPRTSNPGPSQPLIHSSIHSCIRLIEVLMSNHSYCASGQRAPDMHCLSKPEKPAREKGGPVLMCIRPG